MKTYNNNPEGWAVLAAHSMADGDHLVICEDQSREFQPYCVAIQIDDTLTGSRFFGDLYNAAMDFAERGGFGDLGNHVNVDQLLRCRARLLRHPYPEARAVYEILSKVPMSDEQIETLHKGLEEFAQALGYTVPECHQVEDKWGRYTIKWRSENFYHVKGWKAGPFRRPRAF